MAEEGAVDRRLRMGVMMLALVLGACSTASETVRLPPPPLSPPPKVNCERPKAVGRYKVGEPYKVAGIVYRPVESWDYDARGRASWYGAGFHGKQTANGEVFDQDALTAAHQTLPLPSVVRVTNLENGRSLVLRVNDRGPFVAGRILDVSRKAARLLKFHDKGVTQVRVQVLEKESRAAAAEAGWKG